MFPRIATAIFALLFLREQIGFAAGRQSLSGHVPDAVALGLPPIDRLDSAESLHLAISLPLRNQEKLTNLAEQLYDPASPSFHHFLTSEQFTAEFGPTESDYRAVANFAKSKGLTVTATCGNRALLEVEGTVANIEKAFHVNMKVYRHPKENRSFYSPDAEPSLDLDVPVLFIGGLSDYMLPRPASLHAVPLAQRPNLTPNDGAEGGLYIGQDFRGAYAAGITNTGTGQSIGLLEFDTYYPGDITQYLSTAGLANSVILSNVVVGNLTGPPQAGNTEVALDIEMAISMAPGLSEIYVYEATNAGFSADALLARMASDNISAQLSCSWSGFNDSSIRQSLLQFKTQGRSFFQASGDSGEYNSQHNPVPPPCDNPNVTSVGGTTLSTVNGNWNSETTWNWFTQPEDNGQLNSDATSGGVSTSWTIPSWQKGVSMAANQGSAGFRNIPDVAMIANQIYLVAGNGGQYFVGGTSAAAPLWAAFTALVNQQRAEQGQSYEGFLNPALYAIGTNLNYSSCFHDITVGNNTNTYNSTQFFAVAGYDLCTGWGTPVGAALMNALAPEPLQITPSAGFVSSGAYGGPFSVTNQTFTLTNIATSSFNWTLGISSPWLSASLSSGTLVSGGAAATVNVGLNSAAYSLMGGSYTNSITFTNLSDGVMQNFQFILTVTQSSESVNWITPASIIYGTALTTNQLKATATVPGSFAYSPTNGTVLDSGTNALTVIFTPMDTVDYNSVTDAVSVVVTPALLTVTASNASRAYGQTNPLFSGSVTGATNGDVITATFGSVATASSPAGTYAIVPSLNSPETNYTVSVVNGTLTIGEAVPVVIWTNPPVIVYGTVLTTNQLNATANVPGSFAYSPTNGTVLNSGTNTLTVIFTPMDTVDYSSVTDAVSVVVMPAPLTVTASNASRAYGQSNPLFSGSITGATNGDVITATFGSVATASSSAGTYAIIPSLNSPETNYAVSLVNGTLTVGQETPMVTWTNPASIIYGTALTTNQLKATATVPGSFAYSPTNGTVLSSGTNALTVIFTPLDTVDYYSVTDSVSVVVTPAPLTVTASNAVRAYGQTNPVFAGTIEGATNGDVITASYTCAATTISSVGSYPIVPSLSSPETNYDLSLVNGTLTIGQAIPVVTWTNPVSVTYGTGLTTNQLNASLNVAGTFAYTPTNGIVLNTGTNVLTAIFMPSDTVDYLSVTDAVNLVVTPAPLTVTASNESRAYGQTNPVFSGSVVGATNGDVITVSYICVATASSSAGMYAIVPSLNNPETNYNVNLVNGTLTIGQAMPGVTWTNPTAIVYGTALTMNQLNATANVPGSFAYLPMNLTVLDTGTNALTVVFMPTDSVDYISVTNIVNLIVLPAPLTVTASNASRAYGQTNPVFSGSITGATNGDVITATFGSVTTASSPTGNYAIVPNLNNPETNYTVSLMNGTLAVIQTLPVVTWTNPVAIVYGAALTTNQLNATANVPGSFAYSSTNGTVLNSGTNTLTVIFTPTDTVDYNSVTDSVSVVVMPASLTVIASNAVRAYGQTNPVFAGMIEGATNGDVITASYTCAATSSSPAGTYAIASILTIPETNYTVGLVNGTLTVGQAMPLVTWTNPASIIYGTGLTTNQLNATANVPGIFAYIPTNLNVLDTGTNALTVVFSPSDAMDYSSVTDAVSLVVTPAPLTVTASNTSRAYGQTNPLFSGNITGATNGDVITASYACAATANSPAGMYAIVPSLNGLETNYMVSSVNGTLTVGEATPVVTWTNPPAIVYGTVLTTNPLNATATVPGSFAYIPTNLTVLDTGTNTLTMIFTPIDTVDYNSVTDLVSLVVMPAPLTVTASNASRPYGQTNPLFSGSIIGATNGDVITATFGSVATASSPAGTYAIIPSLSSSETNYTVSLVNGTLTVGQATPVVTWTNPASIIYGTGLTTNQLNATANVPGSFAYFPTNLTVLDTGTNALAAIFTPLDLLDYSNVTNQVSLIVQPALVTIVAGITANNKINDGTTTATISSNNVVLSPIVSGDAITVDLTDYSANFASPNLGQGIAVTVSGLALSGLGASNYVLAQPSGLTANIIAPSVQITGSSPNILISWPANAVNYVLQQTASLVPPIVWMPVTNGITTNGATMSFVITPSGTSGYYELIFAPH
jgi:subtilase family serine protease